MSSSKSNTQNTGGSRWNTEGQSKSEDSDYYALLGVSRDATQDQIKKGYKKMALKYHPDHGGDAEIFKKVSHAYSVLSDPEKKQIYDEYGEEGLKEGVGEEADASFDPFDLFGSIFGGFNPFDDDMDDFPFSNARRGRKKNRGWSKPDDIVQQLDCTLEDLYTGSKRSVTIRHQAVCKKCGGSGCNKSVNTMCNRCKGRGVEVKVIRRRGFVQQSSTPCPVCHGSGRFVSRKDQCSACKGHGLITEQKMCAVEVPRGAVDGEEIRLEGEGDEVIDGKPGDVVLVVHELPFDGFIRKDTNLITTLGISLAEALCGFSRVIVMPDGRKLHISVPAGSVIRPNSVKVIYGEGMPSEHTYKGDLIIQFDISFPENLTKEEVEKLEETLHYKRDEVKKDDVLEEVTLCDFDPSRYASSRKGSTASDELGSRGEMQDYSYDGYHSHDCTIF